MPLPLMRCLVLALAATALVAGCGGRVVGSPSPLMMAGGSSEGGYPIAGSGPSGTAIRFIEHGRFAVGIILRNKTGTTVTVVDVRTPEPPLSLVEQVGTRLEPWKPPACPKNTLGCPPGVTFLRMSFGDVRPSPMSVGPGKWLAVQLNYQLASCRVVPLATTASARELQVTFRYSQGRLQHQELPIGAAKLRLSTPAGVECLPRPHSHIGLTGTGQVIHHLSRSRHDPGQRRRHLHPNLVRRLGLSKQAVLRPQRDRLAHPDPAAARPCLITCRCRTCRRPCDGRLRPPRLDDLQRSRIKSHPAARNPRNTRRQLHRDLLRQTQTVPRLRRVALHHASSTPSVSHSTEGAVRSPIDALPSRRFPRLAALQRPAHLHAPAPPRDDRGRRRRCRRHPDR